MSAARSERGIDYEALFGELPPEIAAAVNYLIGETLKRPKVMETYKDSIERASKELNLNDNDMLLIYSELCKLPQVVHLDQPYINAIIGAYAATEGRDGLVRILKRVVPKAGLDGLYSYYFQNVKERLASDSPQNVDQLRLSMLRKFNGIHAATDKVGFAKEVVGAIPDDLFKLFPNVLSKNEEGRVFTSIISDPLYYFVTVIYEFMDWLEEYSSLDTN